MHPLDGFVLAELLNLSLDIDGILAAIDKMLVPSEDKSREERIIQAGYSPYGCAILISTIF